jgi:hypothetical protein
VTLTEFRQIVFAEFGDQLERATPAGVRDFLDRIQQLLHTESGERKPYLIEESASSYEQVFSDFFARTLRMPPERAVVLLWLLAFEQHFVELGEDYERRLASLFGPE